MATTMPLEAPLSDPAATSQAPTWPRADADHLLVTGGQMAAIENQLFASGLPVEALMEKAALAIARRLLARPPAAALVLVGPGHNGGDGLVVARELHLAGVPVRLWTPFERAKPLTSAHLRHCRWLGIPVLEAEPEPGDGALWIDGLFGIGQQRPIAESLASLLSQRHQSRPGALVAIDVPTGLCSDSGRLVGSAAARAHTTYCLGLLKQGLVQDSALAWVGQLERIDLGLPASQLAPLAASQPLALGAADGATAPWPPLDPAAGKYGRGRLLVVAGSPSYPGAAQLCLQGASASGCGSIKALVPEAAAPALGASQPHVVLLDPAALEPPRALERFDAVVVGPGLGANQPLAEPSQQQLWDQLLGFAGLLLLDADGLNRLADLNQVQGTGASQWLRQRQGPTWLTPHGAEFARLFPDWAGLPPLEAAAAAAEAAAATVLLKGAHSVIAAADGRRWQLVETCPGAARAGLGDVLAGYAAGRGAMAMAAHLDGQSTTTEQVDGALLAAAALNHASAGIQARRRCGPGGATPMTVAAGLGQESFYQSAEICS